MATVGIKGLMLLPLLALTAMMMLRTAMLHAAVTSPRADN